MPRLHVLGSPLSWPGMWRWSLHKKVERDPGKSPVLVRILLRELEKVGSWASERWVGGGEEGERSSQVGPQSHHCCIHPPPNSGPLWTSCVIFSSSVSLLYFLKGRLPRFHVT